MDAVLTYMIGTLVRVVIPFGFLLLVGTLMQRSVARKEA